MEVERIEELFKNIGNPGRFQLLSYFCLVTSMVFVMNNHLIAVFYAAKTPHHCKLGVNETLQDFIPIVVRDGEEQLDECWMYTNGNMNETEPCRNGWTYNLPDGENTIISEVLNY